MVKLNSTKATDNMQQDELSIGRQVATEACIQALTDNQDLAVPTWKFMQERLGERKKAVIGANDIADSVDRFQPGSSFASKGSQEFNKAFIMDHSDFQVAALAKLASHDSQVVPDLMVYGTVLGRSQKFPPELLVKQVFYGFLKAAHTPVAARFTQLSKALSSDGKTVNYDKLVVYEYTFNGEGVLIEVKHLITGDTADVNVLLNITRAWEFMQQFDDFGATVVMKPMEPIKVCSFFQEDEGPNQWVNYKKQPKKLIEHAKAAYDEYMIEVNKNKAYQLSGASKKLVKEAKTSASSGALEKARIAGKTAAAKRAVRTKIVISTAPAAVAPSG